MDDAASGLGCALGAGLLVLMLLFGFIGPGFGIPAIDDIWPDTSNGAVVTVQSAGHTTTAVTPDGRPVQITHGDNVLVVVMSSLFAGLGELFVMLCGGGLSFLLVAFVITVLAIAGIGAAAS